MPEPAPPPAEKYFFSKLEFYVELATIKHITVMYRSYMMQITLNNAIYARVQKACPK
jgi:hypothetical protein